jgi:DNA-binding NarL/FixJ family response regulator
VRVLLLEPDFWRFLGISQILTSQPGIMLLGEQDHTKIVGLRRAPPDLTPDVVLISHSLTLDYQLSILEHLHQLFPHAHLLVNGYDDTLDAIADVLRAGATGYFVLTSEPPKLLKALAIVDQGHIWAPREAVALMATQEHSQEVITAREISILKLLQDGCTNKEIALALGIAEVTIKSHLTKLYRKFNVRTRLELLAYALHHHLLNADIERTPDHPV